MSIKINRLEIENVKRVRALKMEPSKNGLTVIGGRNNQGKTSVLDSIAWSLGGEKYRPSEAQNRDSVIPPTLKVTLSNGIIVERKGKNSSLTVTDPSGEKAGQALLNSFIEELALNLPKFMEMNGKDKAKTLLKVIGMEEQIESLEQKEESLYQDRLYKGREKEQKEKYAKELDYFEGVPDEMISASELISEQQKILAKNGENQRKREQKERYERKLEEATRLYKEAEKRLEEARENAETARKSAENLQDESTEELESSIANIELINKKVQTNAEKRKAELIAKELEDDYDELTKSIENTRKAKFDLLKSANLPLTGLSVEDGDLTYNGDKWDAMSSSAQLKVATSIVRAINPDCGFVLMDKMEQMDEITMKEFGEWLEKEGLQVIATRVTANENGCQIIIEDGLATVNKTIDPDEAKPETKTWKAGEF